MNIIKFFICDFENLNNTRLVNFRRHVNSYIEGGGNEKRKINQTFNSNGNSTYDGGLSKQTKYEDQHESNSPKTNNKSVSNKIARVSDVTGTWIERSNYGEFNNNVNIELLKALYSESDINKYRQEKQQHDQETHHLQDFVHVIVEIAGSGKVLSYNCPLQKNMSIHEAMKVVFDVALQSESITKNRLWYSFSKSRFFIGHGGEEISNIPQNKTVGECLQNDNVIVWLPGIELLRQLDTKYVLSVSFHPTEQILASGCYNKTVKLFDMKDGSLIRILDGHGGMVNSVAFSPHGKMLASGSRDKTIILWNIHNGSPIRTLQGHALSVSSVTFSSHGQVLASASYDETIKIWNPRDGSLIRTLEGHTGSVVSVAFSPNNKLLASGSGDNTIMLWSVEDAINNEKNQPIRTLQGHGGMVNSVIFSLDNKVLASGSSDRTVKLWNVHDGSLIRTLEGHTRSVRSVLLSLDNKVLVSGSWDKTVKFWNVEDAINNEKNKPIRTLKVHNGIESLAFNQAGNILAIGADDGLLINNM